jgi:hypothetical protein
MLTNNALGKVTMRNVQYYQATKLTQMAKNPVVKQTFFIPVQNVHIQS